MDYEIPEVKNYGYIPEMENYFDALRDLLNDKIVGDLPQRADALGEALAPQTFEEKKKWSNVHTSAGIISAKLIFGKVPKKSEKLQEQSKLILEEVVDQYSRSYHLIN